MHFPMTVEKFLPILYILLVGGGSLACVGVMLLMLWRAGLAAVQRQWGITTAVGEVLIHRGMVKYREQKGIPDPSLDEAKPGRSISGSYFGMPMDSLIAPSQLPSEKFAPVAQNDEWFMRTAPAAIKILREERDQLVKDKFELQDTVEQGCAIIEEMVEYVRVLEAMCSDGFSLEESRRRTAKALERRHIPIEDEETEKLDVAPLRIRVTPRPATDNLETKKPSEMKTRPITRRMPRSA